MNIFDLAGDDYISYKGTVYLIRGEKRRMLVEFILKFFV